MDRVGEELVHSYLETRKSNNDSFKDHKFGGHGVEDMRSTFIRQVQDSLQFIGES